MENTSIQEKNAKKKKRQQIHTNFDSSKMKCPAAVTVKIGGGFSSSQAPH